MNKILYTTDIIMSSSIMELNNNSNFENISNEELELLDEIYEDENNNIINELYCVDCNNFNVLTDNNNGYIICSLCNSILSKIIDTSISFIDNSSDEKNIQGTILVNKQLPETSTLNLLKGNYSKNIQRLIRWTAVRYIENKRRQFYEYIHQICNKYNFSKTVEETTKIIYNQVYDTKNDGIKNSIFRGDNYKSLIANFFLISCKHNRVVITAKAVSSMFDIKKTDMKRGYKRYKELSKEKNFNLNTIPFTTEEFLIDYFEKLNISERILEYAKNISRNVIKIKIAKSHNPESVAIGILFLVLTIKKVNIPKKIISKKFNVSQVTISKTFKKIKPFSNILLKNKLCDILEKKITDYEENLDNDITYIYNCLKFNIPIKKINTNDIQDKFKKLNELMTLQRFEIINRIIILQNKIIKVNVNHTLLKYKSIKF